jgi:hypothetical protein
MKSLIVSLVLILNLSLFSFARAAGPEYFSSRDSIKEKAHSTSVSQEVIYLGVITDQSGFESGFLVPYRATLKVQYLVAMTSYKGRLAAITVMRAKKCTEPVFRGTCKLGDQVDFVLQPGDVVWITEPYAPESFQNTILHPFGKFGNSVILSKN